MKEFSPFKHGQERESDDEEATDTIISQNNLQSKIAKRLDRFRDVPFKIYGDKTHLLINGPEKYNTRKFDGKPEYYRFLKGCDYLGQFALMFQADTIVFFDRKARGYGLLAQKILPILVLELARRNNVDPNTIKIPKIEFYNSPTLLWHEEEGDESASGHFSDDQKDAHREQINDFQNRIKQGERIVFFDESIGDDIDADGEQLFELISQEGDNHDNRWNLGEISRSCAQTYYKQNFDKEVWPSMSTGVVHLVERRIKIGLTEEEKKRCVAYFEPTVSLYDEGVIKAIQFGLFNTVESNLPHLSREVTPNKTKIPDYFKNKIAPGMRSFGSTAEYVEGEAAKYTGITDTIGQWRKQYRAELERMADELFRQLILKEDPFAVDDNTKKTIERFKSERVKSQHELLDELGITNLLGKIESVLQSMDEFDYNLKKTLPEYFEQRYVELHVTFGQQLSPSSIRRDIVELLNQLYESVSINDLEINGRVFCTKSHFLEPQYILKELTETYNNLNKLFADFNLYNNHNQQNNGTVLPEQRMEQIRALLDYFKKIIDILEANIDTIAANSVITNKNK